MTQTKFFAIVISLFVTCISAQNKHINLEDIWNGSFRTEGMTALHSMKNGQQYSVLNFDRNSRTTTIDVYNYKTLSKEKTLLNSANIMLCSILKIIHLAKMKAN